MASIGILTLYKKEA
ncbi:TPA: hypothetical protein ACOIVA_002004 [Enterococcus faecalis]